MKMENGKWKMKIIITKLISIWYNITARNLGAEVLVLVLVLVLGAVGGSGGSCSCSLK